MDTYEQAYQMLVDIEENHDSEATLNEAQIDFLFTCVDTSDNLDLAAFAATIITKFETLYERLIQDFYTYPITTQIMVVMLLSGIHKAKVYSFILSVATDAPNEIVQAQAVEVLGKTSYFYFPLLLAHMDQVHSDTGKVRLQQILILLGFYNIKPYLLALPQVPHERIFRQTFGDELMDQIYPTP